MSKRIEAVAERYGVGVNTVYQWIKDGWLLAVNVSRYGRKKKWHVTDEALAEFERKRASVPPAPPAPVRRRQTAGSSYYPE